MGTRGAKSYSLTDREPHTRRAQIFVVLKAELKMDNIEHLTSETRRWYASSLESSPAFTG